MSLATFVRGTATLLATALALVGCGASREFVRPTPDALVLGQTTYRDVVARLGPPSREGSASAGELALKTVSYRHSTGRATASGLVPGRSMTFYFRNDLLVGQQFVSSLPEDHTDFDDTKLKAIRLGVTTRGQVIQLLGPPSGSFLYPLAKRSADSGLGYAYAQRRVRGGNLYEHVKDLRVSLDQNDVVNDVKFTASGQR
jgi:hypothetical protein